jgi:fatty acyl-CoA reductase
LVDQYKKIGKFTDILEYFSTREWIFSNKNVHDLWDRLNKDDKTLFPFDIKQMHWNEYLDTYHKGIMTFLLKEGPDKLPAAKKRLRGYV